MRDDLKPRERQVLEFIRAQVKARGISPTYEEIAAACFGSPKSKAAALYAVDALEAAGCLRRIPQRVRAIELLATEDCHRINCPCDACAEARYLADLNLVQALRCTAKITPGVTATNFRPLTAAERGDLLGIPLKPAGARKGAAVLTEAQ
jgi:SOS-response transcriptional repressor LexA